MKKLLFVMGLSVMSVIATAQPSDSALLNMMNAGKMPGASFVVIKEGKWIYSRNLGTADISRSKAVDGSTMFMQASVSKIMIATAVMQLWEKNKIDIDRDVNNYLPFSVRTPSNPNDSITARMLLTHTAAIKDEWTTLGSLYGYGDSPVPLDSFLKNYFEPTGIFYNVNNFYSYTPGTQYNYSNVGATLAAYLVERITGDFFSHYCDTAIFQKICMNSTSFLLSGITDTTRIARPYYWDGANYLDEGLYGYPDYPDGQLRTTSIDLARFMTMYMQNGVYEGTRILDSSTVAYMLQQQTPAHASQGIIFYYGIASNGDTVWGHNGGDAGVNTAMYFSIPKKTGVIVMTNGEGTSGANADLLVNLLYQYGISVTPGINDNFPSCYNATAIQEHANTLHEVAVYPNPGNGTFYVDMPADGTIIVYDMPGRILYSQVVSKSLNTVVMPHSLSSGTYLLKAFDKSGKIDVIQKLVVEK